MFIWILRFWNRRFLNSLDAFCSISYANCGIPQGPVLGPRSDDIFFRNCLGYVWEEQCFTSMVCIWYIMIHVFQTWQILAKHRKPPSDLYCRDEGAHAKIKQGQNLQSDLVCFFLSNYSLWFIVLPCEIQWHSCRWSSICKTNLAQQDTVHVKVSIVCFSFSLILTTVCRMDTATYYRKAINISDSKK